MNAIEKFRKTHECPKCANRYFTLEMNWMNAYVKTSYVCEKCNWGCILMSSPNCTSLASSLDPSSPSRSEVSGQMIRSA